MHPEEFKARTTHRQFLTYCEVFWPTKDLEAKTVAVKQDKAVPTFMPWDMNTAMKQAWRIRLGMADGQKPKALDHLPPEVRQS